MKNTKKSIKQKTERRMTQRDNDIQWGKRGWAAPVVELWNMKFINIYFNNVEILFIKLSNMFLLMSYKFIYFANIKIWHSGADKLFAQIFSIGLIFEFLLLQETTKVLEKLVVNRRKVWEITWVEKNFVAKFPHLPEHHLWNMLEHCLEEGLTFFCWPVWDRRVVFCSFWQFRGNEF